MIEKIKDFFTTQETKFRILKDLLDNKISIEDIKYLSLKGKRGRNEKYIFINDFGMKACEKGWFKEIYIGIWESGVVHKCELKIENGVCECRKTIKLW
ncbi:MAG: hypothetical protein RR835_02930 [Peptostreptococcaceae bacterium]